MKHHVHLPYMVILLGNISAHLTQTRRTIPSIGWNTTITPHGTPHKITINYHCAPAYPTEVS